MRYRHRRILIARYGEEGVMHAASEFMLHAKKPRALRSGSAVGDDWGLTGSRIYGIETEALRELAAMTLARRKNFVIDLYEGMGDERALSYIDSRELFTDIMRLFRAGTQKGELHGVELPEYIRSHGSLSEREKDFLLEMLRE